MTVTIGDSVVFRNVLDYFVNNRIIHLQVLLKLRTSYITTGLYDGEDKNHLTDDAQTSC